MGVAEKDYNESGVEQTALIVECPYRPEEGMQESDLLDQLPDGKAQKDSGTDHVMLVSLGCVCGPKLSFKHIGRGSETLPFDWMRTRSCGLIHFLRNDFDGFFDFATKKAVPGCNMTVYRGYYHSFWHDDPTDPGMHIRYQRRIARFNSIDARTRPVLFVRCIPSTDELRDVPELLELLRSRHGPQASLLLIIDFQFTAKGAAIVEGYENLLIYYLSGDHHVAGDGVTPTPPYCKPVLSALDWIVGKPIPAMKFHSIEKIIECADETHWGYSGLGNLSAFEASLECPEEPPLAPAGPLPAALPLLKTDLLEQGGDLELPPAAADDGIELVSLGCAGTMKRSFQQMGRGAKQLPFDWLRVSHEGLLHFVQKGFQAPTRRGLGAGGQRPMETEGFFDFATRKRVRGTPLTMCRSHLHSAWHDDMADPEVRAGYRARIDNFNSLVEDGNTMLFVRAVATTHELARADELLGALSRRFGQQVALLVVVDFQQTNPGPYIVEHYEDLLVYFLDGSVHKGESAKAPYRKPIECALDWLQGNPLEAACVPDLRTLHELADETCWGLHGFDGLGAFEPLDRAPRTEVESSGAKVPPSKRALAEDAWLEAARTESAKESIALVSLGSHASTVMALQRLDLACEASPFDRVRVRLAGVLHFLRTDFKDFFDVTTTQKVPGTTLTMHRSYHHSFWEEGSADGAVRELHERRIEHLRQLAKSDRPKLFVHAIAATEELALVGEVLEELTKRFSGQVCLLVIVDGQPQPRLFSVEGHYNFLAAFISDSECTFSDGTPYCGPIQRSLDWAVGVPVQAAVVATFDALQSIAAPTSSGLCGLGGLQAFEDAPPPAVVVAEKPGSVGRFAPPPRSASGVAAAKEVVPTPESPGHGVLKTFNRLLGRSAEAGS